MGGPSLGGLAKKQRAAVTPICPLCRVTGPRKRGDKARLSPRGPLGGPPGRRTSLTPRFLRLVTPYPPRPASPTLSTPSKTPQRPPLPFMAATPPPQVPVVDVAAVALEARRSAAAVKKKKNATDLATTQVHVQRLREENRRPNTRSTYNKCWRLWKE